MWMCVGVSACGRGFYDCCVMCLVLNVIFHIYGTYACVCFVYAVYLTIHTESLPVNQTPQFCLMV